VAPSRVASREEMPMRLQTVIRAIVAYGALSVTHSL
jgi:hypothetical protein